MCRACIALIMAASSTALLALDDPTRPPPGLRGATGKPVPGDQALVLQSVIISPSSRSAIISGEHVMLGGRIGGARLVKVSEGAVVLLVGGSQRRLELYPGVQKHAVVGGDEAE
jgi:hypothetical protein